MRRALLVTAAVILALAGGIAVALSNTSVLEWVFGRAAARATARSNTALLADDALRVAIVGTSSPLASRPRANACVAVFAGGKYYLVDVGTGSVENLSLWGVPLASIGAVLLTHFHSDHIGDLGELNLQTWAQSRPTPLSVYGGPGVAQVVEGFNQAYRLDQGYRTAHHTARVMPPETWPMIPHEVELDGAPTPAKSRSAIVLDQGGLKVTAFEVDHAPIEPAYAYRFDYRGRSVMVTGDTKAHPPLVAAAAGVDVLVSEAIARSMVEALERGSAASGRTQASTIMHDIQDYHIDPQQAADLANRAQVKLLVFYHLLPSPDGLLAGRLFAQGVREVRADGWTIADDGSLYVLPIGSSEIRTERMRP